MSGYWERRAVGAVAGLIARDPHPFRQPFPPEEAPLKGKMSEGQSDRQAAKVTGAIYPVCTMR